MLLNKLNRVVIISSPMIAEQSNIDLVYSSFLDEYKDVSIVKKWKDIQHEFIAIIARFILSNEFYKKLILKYKVTYFKN
jgi:hypothetical protein